jgi:hypothetical protein
VLLYCTVPGDRVLWYYYSIIQYTVSVPRVQYSSYSFLTTL